MSEKRKLKPANVVAKIIYPEQYIGYIIFSMFIIAFCIYMAYLTSSDSAKGYLGIGEVFIHTILYIPWILISFYYVIVIVSLVLKRIKLEVNETYIQITKAFLKRKISITDIELIRINRPYKYPLSYVVIKSKKYGIKNSNRFIIFPMSWFSITDIRYVLETVKNYNKKIKFIDISQLNF